MIHKLCILILALALHTQAHAQSNSKATLIHCGTLIAIPGEPPQESMSILIIDNSIDRIITGFSDPESLNIDESIELIDLSDSFVLPGLIDCHTHLTGQILPAPERMRRRMQETEAHAAIDGVANAKKTVEAGITTVRNVGSPGSVALALRDRIKAGIIPGPRMFVSGPPVSVTGGHGDPTNSISPILRPDLPDHQTAVDGPSEARKAVRARVREGVDLIKITATGGVLSPTAAGVEQQFFDDELESIVQAANMMGRKVAAHAHGTNGINSALRAGVDSIEHGTYLDDESIKLFIEHDAYLVPTIHAGKFVEDKAKIDGYFPESIRDKAAAVGPLIQDSFARAYKAGVNIAFGTDVGVGAHGTNAEEFIYMHEAGMSNQDCLISATITAAKLIGAQNQIGTIEQGKLADIIAVKSNPLDDIAALLDVHFVLANGHLIKNTK
ncbi:MAG: amidohydrolase family protein [Phycisphaerales bacterium]